MSLVREKKFLIFLIFFSEDELCKHLTFIKEEAFLICDKLTRESGRLTKLVVVFDMKVRKRREKKNMSENNLRSKASAFFLADFFFFFPSQNVSMGIPAKSIQNGMNKSSEIAQHLYPQLLERVAIINAPWFMKQLWKVRREKKREREK